MAKKKIIVIGFSVTVQSPGFVELISAPLEYSIERFAIGGANMYALLYMLDVIPIKKDDIVLLEVSTSRRWLGEDYQRYCNIAHHIFVSILNKKVRFGILDFSRYDVNPQTDLLHRAILDTSKKLNVRRSSVYLPESDEKRYYLDGIHPNVAGQNIYAQITSKLIAQIVTDVIPEQTTPLEENFYPKFSFVNEITYTAECKFQEKFYEKNGLVANFIEIPEQSCSKFHFDNNYYFTGLLLLIGPESGRIKISCSEREITNTLIYDERSYYERPFAYFFKNTLTDALKIEVIHDAQRPKLIKGSEYKGKQSIKIIGFYYSHNKPSY
jgi:hypothetical protein